MRASIKGAHTSGMAAAAVLEQEGHDLAQPVEVGAVDDRAAAALGADEAGPGQDAEMRGHGVVRDGQLPGDVAGRQAVGLVLHQQPEHVEAGRLGEGREGEDDVL